MFILVNKIRVLCERELGVFIDVLFEILYDFVYIFFDDISMFVCFWFYGAKYAGDLQW